MLLTCCLQLVSVSHDESVRFFDPMSGKQLQVCEKAHQSTIYCLAVTTDGQFFATASVRGCSNALSLLPAIWTKVAMGASEALPPSASPILSFPWRPALPPPCHFLRCSYPARCVCTCRPIRASASGTWTLANVCGSSQATAATLSALRGSQAAMTGSSLLAGTKPSKFGTWRRIRRPTPLWATAARSTASACRLMGTLS